MREDHEAGQVKDERSAVDNLFERAIELGVIDGWSRPREHDTYTIWTCNGPVVKLTIDRSDLS